VQIFIPAILNHFIPIYFRLFPDFSSSSAATSMMTTAPTTPIASSNNGNVLTDDDDTDSEVAGLPPNPDLAWEDGELRCQTLNALNHMRKNRAFCDVTLQVGRPL
jgi:hypothetical protein